MIQRVIYFTILLIFLLIPNSLAQTNELKAAIIIDDFGGGVGGVKEFLEADIPITAAVMPFTKTSTEHANLAHKKGIEVILHLPMQPKRGKASWLGPNPITNNLTPKEVKNRVYQALKTVPHAKGINQHMGSLVVENETIVRAIVEVAREKGLFIIDSGTSPKSKFPTVTEELGVPMLKRDVFLDDISSVTHVKKQMIKLAVITEKKGTGIAIGHVGVTGKVASAGIIGSMKEFSKRGILIVPASELITGEYFPFPKQLGEIY